MNYTNPVFKLNKKFNIFDLRAIEYNNLLDKVKQIVEPVKDYGYEIEDISIKKVKMHQRWNLNNTMTHNQT